MICCTACNNAELGGQKLRHLFKEFTIQAVTHHLRTPGPLCWRPWQNLWFCSGAAGPPVPVHWLVSPLVLGGVPAIGQGGPCCPPRPPLVSGRTSSNWSTRSMLSPEASMDGESCQADVDGPSRCVWRGLPGRCGRTVLPGPCVRRGLPGRCGRTVLPGPLCSSRLARPMWTYCLARPMWMLPLQDQWLVQTRSGKS